MTVSVRAYLTAGMSVVAAGMIAIPPSVAPPAPITRATPVALASSVRPLVVDPPTPQKFAAVVAAIERVDPSAKRAAQQAVSPAVAPAPTNAASDLIVSGYQFIQYWVDYGVQLTNYVLNFIPYGYLIASQVNILYYNLIRPIADSTVYDLVVPVVNEPLNPASYVNGLVSVGQAAINAVINTGIAEFNYFFGWLIPPLPPLPLAAVAKSVPAADEALTPLAREPVTKAVEPTMSLVETHSVSAPVVAPTGDVTKVEDAKDVEPEVDIKSDDIKADDMKADETPKTTKPATTASANGVQAQGEVRGGATLKDEPTSDPKTTETRTTETKTTETKTPETKTAETKTPETSNEPKDVEKAKD